MSLILDGVDQYLSTTTLPVSAFPLTVNIMCKPVDSPSVVRGAWSLAELGAVYGMELDNRGQNNAVRATSTVTVTSSAIATAYTDGVWNAMTVVFASSTDRRAYLNGGSEALNTEFKDPFASGTMDTLLVGAKGSSGPTGYIYGRLAGYVLWDATLSAATIANLITTTDPTTIQPDDIVHSAHFLSDASVEVGGAFTENNSPTYDSDDHPYTIASAGGGVGKVIGGGLIH